MTEVTTLTALATITLSDDHTTAVTPLTMAMSTTQATMANTLNNTEGSKNAATSTEPISYAVGILTVFLLLIGTSMVVMLILYMYAEKSREIVRPNLIISIEYRDYCMGIIV